MILPRLSCWPHLVGSTDWRRLVLINAGAESVWQYDGGQDDVARAFPDLALDDLAPFFALASPCRFYRLALALIDQRGSRAGLGKMMAGKMMAGKMMAGKMMAGKMMAGKMMAGKMMLRARFLILPYMILARLSRWPHLVGSTGWRWLLLINAGAEPVWAR